MTASKYKRLGMPGYPCPTTLEVRSIIRPLIEGAATRYSDVNDIAGLFPHLSVCKARTVVSTMRRGKKAPRQLYWDPTLFFGIFAGSPYEGTCFRSACFLNEPSRDVDREIVTTVHHKRLSFYWPYRDSLRCQYNYVEAGIGIVLEWNLPISISDATALKRRLGAAFNLPKKRFGWRLVWLYTIGDDDETDIMLRDEYGWVPHGSISDAWDELVTREAQNKPPVPLAPCQAIAGLGSGSSPAPGTDAATVESSPALDQNVVSSSRVLSEPPTVVGSTLEPAAVEEGKVKKEEDSGAAAGDEPELIEKPEASLSLTEEVVKQESRLAELTLSPVVSVALSPSSSADDDNDGSDGEGDADSDEGVFHDLADSAQPVSISELKPVDPSSNENTTSNRDVDTDGDGDDLVIVGDSDTASVTSTTTPSPPNDGDEPVQDPELVQNRDLDLGLDLDLDSLSSSSVSVSSVSTVSDAIANSFEAALHLLADVARQLDLTADQSAAAVRHIIESRRRADE